jgi:type I restriction enzyme, S subunit
MLSKAKIKEFAKVGAGQGAPQRETDFSTEGIPFIRAGSIEELLNGGDEMALPKVNSEIAKEYRLKVYPPNTIVFAKSGMSAMKGRIYKLKNPCYVVNHLATLELNENAFPDYIVYTLRRFSPVRLINDISYPSLKQSKIENYEIPFPCLIEQIQIANILKQAEDLINQRTKSIDFLDELLKNTFLEMFGTPTSNKNKFPIGKIRDVVTEVKYGTSKPAEEEGKYPYLRMNNITTEGYWDLTKLKYINMDDDEKEKCVVRKGDLLFNRTNSKELVGKTAVFNLDDEMIIAGYLIRVRFKEIVNPYFVWGYLNSLHGKQTLLGMCKSIVGMANINAQELQNIKILIPPIELQTQFAIIVSKTEKLKDHYKNSLQQLENLYGKLSQQAFQS